MRATRGVGTTTEAPRAADWQVITAPDDCTEWTESQRVHIAMNSVLSKRRLLANDWQTRNVSISRRTRLSD
jgi:hypothetical protein